MKNNLLTISMIAAFTFTACKEKPNAEKTEDKTESTETKASTEISDQTFTDLDGRKLEVKYNEKSATVTFNGEKIELKEGTPASGFLFENDHYELQGKGNVVEFRKDDVTLFSNYIIVNELKNYFVKNDYKDAKIHYVKINSEAELNKIFGVGQTMGKDGGATKVDFAKSNVIAIIDETSDKPIELIVSLYKDKEDLLISVNRDGVNADKQSFKGRAFKIITFDKRVQGNIKFDVY